MEYREIYLRDDNSAKIETYILDGEISHKKYKRRPLIVICPGGAYLTLARKEGEAVAARFLGLGFNVIVLKYITYFKKRPEPPEWIPEFNIQSQYPEQLNDLILTMKIIKENIDNWYIDKDRIYTLGFSAGAHLVGMFGENWSNEEYLKKLKIRKTDIIKPAGILMAYPMITVESLVNKAENSIPEQMLPTIKYIKKGIFGTEEVSNELFNKNNLIKNVNKEMPRVFIWQPMEDKVVSPLDTIEFIKSLYELGIPVEGHLFENGGHGMALCDDTTSVTKEDYSKENQKWIELAKLWLDLDLKNDNEVY